MTRAAFGSIITLTLLLPVAWIGSDFSLVVPIPGTDVGSVVVSLSELIFIGIPVLFILFMIIEATGHVRERKPPS
jgi:hypothetical protein